MSAIIVPMDKARAGRLLAQRASDLRLVARRLIAARQAAGLRHADVVAGSGVGSSQYAQWEMARSRPRVDQLGLVLPFLDVTSDWIYFGDDRGLSWEKRAALLQEMEKLAAADAESERAPPRDILRLSERKA